MAGREQAAVKGPLTIRARAGDVYRSLRINGVGGSKLRVKVHATKLRGRDKPRLSASVNESRRSR